MMPISIRTLDRIGLTIVIITLTVCGFGLVQLGIKERGAIRQEKAMSEKQANDLKLAESNLKQLQTSIEATRAGLKVLNERIPENADMGAFLKEIAVLMKKRGIGLITVQPQTPVKGQLHTQIPIRLVFKGSFFNISLLLQDLEAMQRLVIMDKMVMGKAELSQDCQVDLMALIFEREKVPVKS